MCRPIWPWLVATLLVAVSAGAPAQQIDPLRERLGSTDFTLRADVVSYDRNRDVYEASGNVRVEQSDGRVLSTDWLVFNGTTRVGVAGGSVNLVDAGDTMHAEFMAVDLRTMVAMATEAALDTPSPGFAVEGATLQRTGVDTFRLEHATFTTCRCPGDARPRPWELEVDDARIEIGGYAVGRNLRFKAFGVPVFYLPWIAFPAKTERQSGFLLPNFSLSGRNGFELETPFFWAVSDPVNFTFRPQLLSKRGVKLGGELEYVFGDHAWGELAGNILPDDDEVKRDDFETPFSDDRWSYRWRHDQPLTEHARLGLDLIGISDNQYPVDFDDLPRDLRNERFVTSTGWAAHADPLWYAGVQATTFDDLQSPTDLDRDDFFLHRLPDIQVARLGTPFLGLPLRFGFDSRYTYFHQVDGRTQIAGMRSVRDQFFDTGRDALFDAQEPAANGSLPGGDVHRDNLGSVGRDRSEGDGLYQEGELLADDGHRFDVYPHVALPQRVGLFETLTEVGYRETLYFPDAGSTERREMWTGRFDLRTRLARSFSFRSLPMRHLVEPRFTFAAVSSPSQRRNPLFVPESSLRAQRLIDGDVRLLTRNPSDRVEEERLVQFQVGNRFYGPSREGGLQPALLGEVRLGAGYDLERSDPTRLFANGLVRPLERLEIGFDVGWDPNRDRFDEALAALRWDAPRGHYVDVSYRYLRERIETFENFVRQNDIFDEFDDDERVSQLGLDSFLVVTRKLSLFARGFVAFTQSSSSAGRVGLIVGSDCRCWDLQAEIEHRTRPSETRFNLELRLTGLGGRQRRR